ncbi:type II toxin-antitoxin system VapC family toxin [Okeania sp. SIO1I7]|uniref:type II toxin-antitoxin system VapC family toxin n=1 Tax=Okeania sp. SIO1I7 TaxID=2607772 RepID=UPI0013FCBCC2|nr:type II toxin-antitoxin system VapC family toxin [Okeania sp. SIO1I7]NET28304.1 type II toxin-antitoxin system VapC family toxin [Okeania sp. SIO1I7]
MSLWVLDTDHVSLFQRGHPIFTRLINRAKAEEVAVTVVTAEEQLRGQLHIVRRANSADALVSAYAKLRATLDYFRTANLLNFDENAYYCYESLVTQKIRIGTRDLRIAAIVISQNGILLTRNRRDFERVPGLQFEDWTIE